MVSKLTKDFYFERLNIIIATIVKKNIKGACAIKKYTKSNKFLFFYFTIYN